MLKNSLSTANFFKSPEKLDVLQIQQALLTLGIRLDIETGHLFYQENFKPPHFNFDLIFVRHGETYGNAGQSDRHGNIHLERAKANIKCADKCIYQGDVDTEINKLNSTGTAQALQAAKLLTDNFLDQGWIPDVIFTSPLSRAKNTADPFIQRHRLENKYFIHEGIKEMSFGAWDNRRLCDLPKDHVCHLFYLNQHALVKESGENANHMPQEAENFCEVLLRAYSVLKEIHENHAGKKVLMFSHSMFGAACCILLGKGQLIENGAYLAFDGKRSNGESYTMPHATPFVLNEGVSLTLKPGCLS